MKRFSMLIVLVSLMGINAFAQTAQPSRTAHIKANLGLAKPELMGSSSRLLDCDTFVNLCPDDTLVIYATGAGGYVAGQNGYGDIAKADIFYLPGTTLKGCLLYFGVASAANTTDKFSVTAWDNDGTFADASPGAPGTILATKLVNYADVVTDVTNNDLTYVAFPNGGPAIPVDSIFYCGIQFGYTAGDTIALLTTLDRAGLSCDGMITAVEEWNPDDYGAGWYTYETWGFNGVSNMILPITCKEPCTANITPGSPLVCKNKEVTLTATGGGTYTWAPAATLNVSTGAVVIASPTESTTYTVTVNGGECSDSSIVTWADSPGSNFTIGDCSAGSRLLSRTGTPTTGVTFKWFRNDVKITGSTNATYLATISGDYKVQVRLTETGCKNPSPTKTVTIDCKLGDAQQFTAEAYPNPFNQAFTINMDCGSNELANVRLTDVSGRVLHEYQGVDTTSPFEINETLAPGVYFVRVNQAGNEKMIKIIKD